MVSGRELGSWYALGRKIGRRNDRPGKGCFVMKREAVTSSSIAAVGYDPATNVLEIEFSDGGVYQYFAVPHSTHAALMAAERKGAFVNSTIKPRHRFVEVY